MPNSLSCIVAAAPRGNDDRPCLQDIPAFYMKKLAYPLGVRRAWIKDRHLPIHVDAPIEEVIDVTARVLGKGVRDVVVCILDRARNEHLIESIRRKGAAVRLIMDGDISAALAPAMHASCIDLYAGIGGAPERTNEREAPEVSSVSFLAWCNCDTERSFPDAFAGCVSHVVVSSKMRREKRGDLSLHASLPKTFACY